MALKFVRDYLQQGLAATPIVLGRLLAGLSEEELDWTPDPERFTIREAIAHLADWEAVWLQRIRLIQLEINPLLPSYDEGQMALDHDYAHSDFHAKLENFRDGRAALIEFLAQLSDADWPREGIRKGIGSINIFDLSTLILGHDAYHLRQVSEYRSARESS